MMPRNVSITLGRPLGATLLLAGLLLVGLLAIAATWAEVAAGVEERDTKADLLERSIAASRRAALQPAGAVADPFVAAATETLAAARVDADLRALALDSGLSLRSSRAEAKPDTPQAEAPASAGIGTRIEVQAVVEGPNEALQVLLARLEGGDPVVLVDQLSVEPAEVEPGLVVDARAPRLRASLTLTAFWRPPRT